MRLIVRDRSVLGLLKCTQSALFVCAVLLLGYSGVVLVDSWTFQRRETRELERQLRIPRVANAAVSLPAAARDGVIGRLEIPRLRVSLMVAEGIDETTLRRAAGHIPGTALPGEAGNVGLAAHRDTFFRPLKDLKVKDEIQLSTSGGIFRYQVVSLKIVAPGDVGVLASSGESVLTLVTCYPFYFVGPAPKRWVVTAKEVAPTVASSTMK